MNAHIFLAPGFEEIEAITVIDVLRRAEFEVVTVSIPNDDDDEFWVEGAHGVSVFSDIDFEYADFSETDILILPGGQPGTTNLSAHKGLQQLLLDFATQKKHIAAICAAPMILGDLGLLKGKKATCYPGCESRLTGATVTGNAVEVADTIITGNGPGAAMAFALAIVETLKGSEIAQTVKKQLMMQ
ncbi:MAG: DJ-1/PfpI family protein [Bacteroidales bacterium]|jgi:4-methyl-5(b-hydroxyethyl)-thiazole monophosphate biosynthesis|nr:DJ-1/PfpI family protein [Bacteroidales bacterium]